jgi:hypothetical protein
LKDSIYFPSVISPVARDLLEQLVDQNSWKWLGTVQIDNEKCRTILFSRNLLEKYLRKIEKPEWIPRLKNDIDTSNLMMSLQEKQL